jgi:hypothetical protein
LIFATNSEPASSKDALQKDYGISMEAIVRRVFFPSYSNSTEFLLILFLIPHFLSSSASFPEGKGSILRNSELLRR